MKITAYNDKIHRSGVIDLWKQSFGYPQARNKPDLVIYKKQQVNDGLFFIAEENDEVIGSVMAGYDGHRGWIYLLAVRKDKRNFDTGTELLKHAEKKLIQAGCVKINLQVMEENEKTAEFYLKNGYKTEPRISMGKVIEEDIQ